MADRRAPWLVAGMVVCAGLTIACAPRAPAMPVLSFVFKPLATNKCAGPLSPARLRIMATDGSAKWCIASWLKPR